jgi:hypothetical protein
VPLELGPKEGLALLNGTQVSTALALGGLFRARGRVRGRDGEWRDVSRCLAGKRCAFRPAHSRSCAGIPARSRSRRCIVSLLAGSEIRESHRTCERVQDPYSLRCQPQVMGACLDLITQSAETLLTEANAVTDNPLIFRRTAEVLSGGNFHAEPVAFAADILALACGRSRLDRRAPHLLAGRSENERPAGLPRARQRRELRLHDGAGHCCRAGGRKPHAMPSRQRRQHSNFREPGRSRQHGNPWCAPPAHDDQQPAEHRSPSSSWPACQGIDFRKPLKTSGSGSSRPTTPCARRCRSPRPTASSHTTSNRPRRSFVLLPYRHYLSHCFPASAKRFLRFVSVKPQLFPRRFLSIRAPGTFVVSAGYTHANFWHAYCLLRYCNAHNYLFALGEKSLGDCR